MFYRRFFPVACFACLAIAIPHPAFAYIDPGLGSLVFQGAVALFITIATAWAALRLKVRQLFCRFFNLTGARENAQE